MVKKKKKKKTLNTHSTNNPNLSSTRVLLLDSFEYQRRNTRPYKNSSGNHNGHNENDLDGKRRTYDIKKNKNTSQLLKCKAPVWSSQKKAPILLV